MVRIVHGLVVRALADTCLHGSWQNVGGVHSEAGGDYTYDWSIAFIENNAGGLGGAMHIDEPGLLEVDDAMFKSNRGSLGGAIYIAAADDKHTTFSACVFEGNAAEDGGALYLYTGPGLDIFTESVFRNNYARESPGPSGVCLMEIWNSISLSQTLLIKPDRTLNPKKTVTALQLLYQVLMYLDSAL